MREIGRRLNVSATNVTHWAKKYSLRPSKWVRTTALSTEDVDKIKEATASSRSYGEVLKKLNLSSQGSRYKTLKRRVIELGLDTSHFMTRSEMSKAQAIKFTDRTPDELIFCENSTVARHTVKKRLLKTSLIEYKCEKCGQDEMWHGERITLILDHINGVNNDNRKENLRFVCPNCAATLPTHCRGFKALVPVVQKAKKALNNHRPYVKNRRVTRPPFDILTKEVDVEGYSAVGRKYGVSDVSIKKWIRSYQKYGV